MLLVYLNKKKILISSLSCNSFILSLALLQYSFVLSSDQDSMFGIGDPSRGGG